jgi:phenylacetate-CoA ligase
MMNEELFLKNLPAIKRMLAFALDNPYSDFYRRKYAGLNITPNTIDTYDDFCKIPCLTKDEILALPMDKRFFVPVSDVIRYSTSSGTTSQNRPLVLPRIGVDDKYKNNQTYNEDFLSELGIDKLFSLMPMNSILQDIFTDNNRKLPVVTADPNKLDLAVVLANELSVEAILSTTTTFYFFTEKLKKTKFNFSQVKWISIGSEFCTLQKFEYFKKNYPNAIFIVRYGNSEIGKYVGYRCEYLRDQGPQIFHPSDINLTEVVPVAEYQNGLGEVVFTHLYKAAFPFIRYRTGDFATPKPFKCKCGQGYIIDNSGKKDLDVLKTSGAMIHTQAIANALEGLSEYIEPDFQMHVYEETQNSKIVTRLLLELIPRQEIVNLTEITRYIENQLMVAFNKTLLDLIKEGIFLPLEIKLVSNIKRDAKSKNIISHLHTS